MTLKILPPALTVCKIPSLACADLTSPFTFLGVTDEELSLVCPSAVVPPEALSREDGWRAMRIEGTLDFSLVGILAPIARILAESAVGIFAVSTFNTDYILVKEENLEKAASALRENGYTVV